MTDNQLTLISIVNNQFVFDEFKTNLSSQKGISYKFIPLFNINNSYSGAREAFESCIDEIEGDYVMYLHPDIRFLNDNSLKSIYDYCNMLKRFGVVGIAGSPSQLENGNRIIYSTIIHGEKKIKAGRAISAPMPVQTVDESLFVLQSEYIKKNHFSNKPGWHLYAVEQCLKALRNNRENYVVPANVWHMSDGKSLDPNYVLQIKALLDEYDEFDFINTTVKKWSNKDAKARIYIKYYYYKQLVKKVFSDFHHFK